MLFNSLPPAPDEKLQFLAQLQLQFYAGRKCLPYYFNINMNTPNKNKYECW